MGITVCKDCKPPIRHEGCHGTCEKYLKEKADLNSKKEKYRKEHYMECYKLNTNGTMWTTKKSRKRKSRKGV